MQESFSQNSLLASENWVTDSPSGNVFRKISVQTDPGGNVYVAGHLLNGSGNHDIIIQKFDNTGALLWEETYDGTGNGEDFAAALFVDASGNVYVTGATTVSSTVGFSIVALKFKENGVFEWEYVYNNGSTHSPLAGGTAIHDDGTYTYVTGSCFGATTSADFVTIKLNSSDGSEIWSVKKDKNSLRDFPIAVQIRPTAVTARGVAEVAPGAFMGAGVTHDKITGADTGIVVAGDTVSGINDIFDVVTDSDGNTFMAGTTYSPASGYDWLMLWLAPDYSEVLRITETSAGNADDRALAVLMDMDDNFYVAGYFSVAGEGKNIGVAKYSTAGDLLWKRTYNGEANTDDIALRMSPAPNGMGGVFITGYVHNGPYSDYITIGYDGNGTVRFQKEFDSPFGLDDVPTDMIADGNSLTVVGNCRNALGQYKPYIVNYRIRQRNFDLALDTNGVPMYLQNELIIRFNPEVVNTAFVNSPKTIINLAELVSPTVITAMSNKTGFNFDDDNRGDVWVQKIFIGLDTTDTLSTSRSGNEIKIDPLWSAFVVHFVASDSTLGNVADSLNFLPDYIQYAHFNAVGTPTWVPDDTEYGEQNGFKNNADYAGGVGIEGAWNIERGKKRVFVGIYDYEMDWAHPDFGDGTYNGSVVRGWDFCHGIPLSQIPAPEHFHGTNVGGIIGAIKNNNKGVAGIAGKDPTVTSSDSSGSGATLFSYKVLQYAGTGFAAISDLAYAIHWGANYSNGYGAGLHVQNHSWQVKPNTTYGGHTLTQTELQLLKDAVRSSWMNECTFVAGRGNDNTAVTSYPACYPDSWVISVGASGTDGERKIPGTELIHNGYPPGFGSSYGQNMDLIAPGVTQAVYTTGTTDPGYNSLCPNNQSNYSCAAGASVAAPHVSGSAALVLSEQNTAFQHHPANLTGEDIEHLMELTADKTKGTDSLGYDDVTGWGLLRMDSLMPLMKAPEYRVIHFPGDVPTQKGITLQSANVTVQITEPYNQLAPGYYIADRYLATLIFSDNISPAEHIGSWARLAGADGLPGNGIIANDAYNAYGAVVLGGNNVLSEISCYFYFIKYPQGSPGNSLNKWLPHDTVKTYTPYSIWVYDPTHFGTSIKEHENIGSMKVFPVPSSESITVEFTGTKNNEVLLALISLEGKPELTRLVVLVDGKGTVQMDVRTLSRGIYFLKADYGTHTETKKVIVQ